MTRIKKGQVINGWIIVDDTPFRDNFKHAKYLVQNTLDPQKIAFARVDMLKRNNPRNVIYLPVLFGVQEQENNCTCNDSETCTCSNCDCEVSYENEPPMPDDSDVPPEENCYIPEEYSGNDFVSQFVNIFAGQNKANEGAWYLEKVIFNILEYGVEKERPPYRSSDEVSIMDIVFPEDIAEKMNKKYLGNKSNPLESALARDVNEILKLIGIKPHGVSVFRYLDAYKSKEILCRPLEISSLYEAAVAMIRAYASTF